MRPRRRWDHFARHLVAMVLAMVLGMAVLSGALRSALTAAGVTYSMATHPTLTVLEMAVSMAVGMAAWMALRRHVWREVLEMSAAMVLPVLLVIPPMWVGVLAPGTAMLLEHVVMIAGMVVVMLRRRDRYAPVRTGPPAARRWRAPRPVVLGLAGLLAVVAVPALVLGTNAVRFAAYRYAPPAPAAVRAVPAVAPRPHDASKPTAVVVVGEHGANVSDTLVPYEVLAATGAFNVYTVAPERRPVPLLGGLDLVPDLDLGELESRLAGAPPAVTVVPEMPDLDPSSRADDAAVTGWLRERASRGLVLGVCTGARLVAEAGLLEGRAATSHWYRIDGLEEDHPDTSWRRGVRYVDAGEVVTTAGLLSSVDGTLRVIERLLGPTGAAAAARRVGWPSYSPGAPAALPPSGVTPERGLVHVLNLGFRSGWTTVGVPLTDGVGELALAAALGPYAEVKAAQTLTIGDRAVRSRHGLTFVPRAGTAAVSEVDRLLVPAGSGGSPAEIAADETGTAVERLDTASGFAFDPALRSMARTMDRPTARWAAVVLEYRPDDLRAVGPPWPWSPTGIALVLGLVGAAAAAGVLRLGGRRPRSRRYDGGTASHPVRGPDPRGRSDDAPVPTP